MSTRRWSHRTTWGGQLTDGTGLTRGIVFPSGVTVRRRAPRRDRPAGRTPPRQPGCGTAACTTPGTPPPRFLLGVPERAVMGVMGWSNTAMAARYQHVTATIQRDIAARVGGLIWQLGDGN